MLRPHPTRLLTSFALVAVLTAVGAPLVAACPVAFACPMAAAMPSPPPCHGEAAMLGHGPARQRLAADVCCVQAPPALVLLLPSGGFVVLRTP
jgi:hypothetical protein